MRILTLWQPWASLIALGLKQHETRSWGTGYRGELAIHAAKRLIDDDGLRLIWKLEELTGKPLNPVDFKYPLGCIVAIADLTDCLFMQSHELDQQSKLELAVGNWQVDRYAWKLENVRAMTEQIPYKGGQGLRQIHDAATLDAIAARLAV